MTLPRFNCSHGHDRVEWGFTGGYQYRTRLGIKTTDDSRCWYCGHKVVPNVWPSVASARI